MAEVGIIFVAQKAAEVLAPFLTEGGEKLAEWFIANPEIAKKITEFQGNAKKLVKILSKEAVEHYREIGIVGSAATTLHGFFHRYKRNKNQKEIRKDLNSVQEISEKNKNDIGVLRTDVDDVQEISEKNKNDIVNIYLKLNKYQVDIDDLIEFKNIFMGIFRSPENLSTFLNLSKRMPSMVMNNERRIDDLERRPRLPGPKGDKGDKGDKGTAGPAGPAGPARPERPAATPQQFQKLQKNYEVLKKEGEFRDDIFKIAGGTAAVGAVAYAAPVVFVAVPLVAGGLYTVTLPVTGAVQTLAWVTGRKGVVSDMYQYNFWWCKHLWEKF